MPTTVTPGLLAQINTGFNGRFMRGFEKAAPFYDRIAMVIDSQNAVEVYPFLGDLPGVEEWIGDRQIRQLKAYDLAIKNRHFELTVRVNKDRIEDNQMAGFYPIVEIMGRRMSEHPDELMAVLLEGGFTANGYDGTTFFSTTHTGGSNKGTTALSSASYGVARALMMNVANDQGKKLSIRPNLLIVPPALEETGSLILNADYISVSSGSTQNNIYKGSAELLVLPQLTDATNWYLLDTRQPLPALIMQFRKRPVFTPRTSLTDDNVFWKNEFVWGSDYRGEAGYGAWQSAFGALVAG